MRSRTLLSLCLAVLGSLPWTGAAAQENETWRSWNRPVEPFRIAGNLYYVGANEIAAYLVATPAGHILVDGGFPETAPLIEASVEALGFDLDDVEILLNSHAHFDHAGGLARLKERTGARLMAMAEDAEWLRTGDAGFGRFPPVAVDRELRHGDVVELGGTELTAHHTPGHTPGCTTWTLRAEEGGESYEVVIVGSPNALPEHDLVADPDYPHIADDFALTFERMKRLRPDIFLASHGSFFGLSAKREALAARSSPAVFLNRADYDHFVERKEESFLEELRRQRAAATAQTP